MQNLLNNTDTLVDVVGKMNAVVTEVAAQATQIEEIAALLEGKSVPGGGGSGNYETAEVYINGCRNVYYTGVENGVIVAKASEGGSRAATHTIQVCCNMPVVCGYIYNETPAITTGITKIGGYSTYIVAYTIPNGNSDWTIDYRGGGSSSN